MQIIARKTLLAFWSMHPEAKPFLERWEAIVKAASWQTMSEIQGTFPKAKVLNGERVRFEGHHNDFRMVVAST